MGRSRGNSRINSQVHNLTKTRTRNAFAKAHPFAWKIYMDASAAEVQEEHPHLDKRSVHDRARTRALQCLKEDHPDEYKRLYTKFFKECAEELGYPLPQKEPS